MEEELTLTAHLSDGSGGKGELKREALNQECRRKFSDHLSINELISNHSGLLVVVQTKFSK